MLARRAAEPEPSISDAVRSSALVTRAGSGSFAHAEPKAPSTMQRALVQGTIVVVVVDVV
jgi:hypothetical protein